jgi:hypothetical protein
MKSSLASVGSVFEVFPGQPCKIIGIHVAGWPFGTGNDLTFVNPSKPEDSFTMKLNTLEIDHVRRNKVESGDQCAIKPLKAERYPKPGWQVFVPDNQARGAEMRTLRTWPRPQPKPVQSEGYVKPYTW